MDWDDARIEQLRAYWAEGLSTAEIGRRMNISKNSVVGKAHRLNLTARPSPIRRDGAAAVRPAAPRRMTGPTLPPLVAPPAPTLTVPAGAGRTGAALRDILPAAKAAPPLRPLAPRVGRQSVCCWPIGEPGTKSFHFCDAEAVPAKPYCTEHAQIAYVRIRDRREDAA